MRQLTWTRTIPLAALSMLLLSPPPAAAWAVQAKSATEERVDLREVERRLMGVLERSRAATVQVQVRYPGFRGFVSNGSGVVVSGEGYVLTAAHVALQPDLPAMVTFPDGRRVRGVTLGRTDHTKDVDAGVIKLDEPGPYPVAPMGEGDAIQPGDWCFALGHPEGFDANRGAVVRIGRVIGIGTRRLWTDCVLLGGDSGGPLFDLNGRVVGIHSAIAGPTESNFHAPIGAFRERWRDLTEGFAVLGVSTEAGDRGAVVSELVPNSGAKEAGVAPGDVIIGLEGYRVTDPGSLRDVILRRKPGDKVRVDLLRDGRPMQLTATLGRSWVRDPEIVRDEP